MKGNIRGLGYIRKYVHMGITVVVWLTGLGSASALEGIEHELTVQLKPSQQRLQAVDVVTISQPAASHLSFDLAEHLTIDGLTLNDRDIPFVFKRGRVRIALPAGLDRHRLKIVYSGKFDDEIPTEPLNTDNPGFGVTGTISRQGTMLLPGAQWYPMTQEAVSTYDISVTAPEGMVAVTSGKLLEHTTEMGRTRSRWRVAHPLRGIPLVAGPYIVATRRFGNVTAATYFSKALERLSDDYLMATGRYLKLYQELFGPYPHGQFAVVENFFPTGYGFSSFTLIGGRVLQLPFIIHTSLGHEIAHCWWGNGVLVDPSQGNWSEGLTTYVADYLYKERRGQGPSYRLQWLRNYAGLVNESNDFAASQFSSRTDPATKAVGYDKVAMVFHMLRRIVGEDIFWQVLRDVYGEHRSEAISWSQFQTSFEARAGRSLERFFKQWVFRPGAPVLRLSDVAATQTRSGIEISGRVVQEKPYYELALDLELTTEKETVSHTVTVSGGQTPFSIAVSHPPKQLTADPQSHLFRRLMPEEVPPTINTIKGAASVTIIVARHLDSDGLKIARRLSKALGLKNVRIGMEDDFKSRDLRRNDLLFVGNPSQTGLIPVRGTQFQVDPKAWVLKGRRYLQDQASFFGVFSHPQNKSRAMALFMPSALSTAKALSTKIPHYGNYSYLVFNRTRNEVKGTWAADRSPMVVRWPLHSDPPTGGK